VVVGGGLNTPSLNELPSMQLVRTLLFFRVNYAESDGETIRVSTRVTGCVGEKNAQNVAQIYFWGRYYDHNFLRFLPIFGEKIGVFLKTNVMIKILQKNCSILNKPRHFLQIFGENTFKSITSVPGQYYIT
jgi:hypothetical protein